MQSVCVCVDGWACCGQCFLGFRATPLIGQLAQPHNPSGLITASVYPPLSLSPPQFTTRSSSQPCVARMCPHYPLWNIYHAPREQVATTAGSSHTDCLGTHADSDARGNILLRERYWRVRGDGGLVWSGACLQLAVVRKCAHKRDRLHKSLNTFFCYVYNNHITTSACILPWCVCVDVFVIMAIT